MTELAICNIQEEDVATVIALWQACGLTRPWNDPHNDIAFARAKPTSTLLVGRKGPSGPIVASIMVGHDGHRGWVYYLAVAPEHQRIGIGQSMMKAAEDWLLRQGIWKTQLMVRTGNEKVIRFYESLGYNVSQTQVLERWIDPSKRGVSSSEA
ncbi:GNAT family acetyltransferase [Cohaesibacter celericrescens]|uniref:GNAT family acetyltransferase n=1 Tax=Cohaesibacter celericrescens TaxID=2067669 RepID=A0A2N5XL21_9HYPH|nr:GNAT family acetyltransferase [Cohaesibacter celericrescens]PLW75120.1 GNAT family acetyltransferase [Cohaesibacter celericrescens]